MEVPLGCEEMMAEEAHKAQGTSHVVFGLPLSGILGNMRTKLHRHNDSQQRRAAA